MNSAKPHELKMTGLFPLLIKPIPEIGFNNDGCACIQPTLIPGPINFENVPII